LFGMRGGDPRLFVMLGWPFLLAPFAFLERLAALLARPSPSASGEPPLPQSTFRLRPTAPWWWAARAALVLFLLVSSARLIYFTATREMPPCEPRFYTAREARQIVAAMNRHRPGLLREEDVRPGRQLVCLPRGAGSDCAEKLYVFR